MNPGGDRSPRCCSFAPLVGDELSQPRPALLATSVGYPPTRPRARILSQAGNSMQLCTVGAVIMYALLFVELKDKDEELDEFFDLF